MRLRAASQRRGAYRCDAGTYCMGIEKVESSDAELVRRVRAGDIGAYGVLVSRYRDRLGRYAIHMIGDREDAEEALQDSFVRAYRSLARCDDPARFGAWRSEERRVGKECRSRWSPYH